MGRVSYADVLQRDWISDPVQHLPRQEDESRERSAEAASKSKESSVIKPADYTRLAYLPPEVIETARPHREIVRRMRGHGVRTIARRFINEAMDLFKVTQGEIAEACGFSKSTFSLMLNGKYEQRRLTHQDLDVILMAITNIHRRKYE